MSAVVSIEKSREVERGRDKWEPLLADMGTLASPRVHQPTTDKIRSGHILRSTNKMIILRSSKKMIILRSSKKMTIPKSHDSVDIHQYDLQIPKVKVETVETSWTRRQNF